MKNVILIVLMFFAISIFAQKPETVHQMAIKAESFDFYKTQAEAWNKVIKKDKTNEEAWYNYYKACRYARMMFMRAYPDEAFENWVNKSKAFKNESDIIALINTNIPNTFTSELLKYNESFFSMEVKENREKHLLKAYEINPNHPEVQDEIVLHYEFMQNLEKRKELNKNWFKLNSMASEYINYAYNVLMSMEDDAIIFTAGDNDTYSLWMVQDVLNISPNVMVLNSSLICKPDYRAKMFAKLGIPEVEEGYNKKEGSTFSNQKAAFKHVIKALDGKKDVYVALTAHKELYQDMEDDFYLTGLAKKYSKDNLDEIAYIKRNFHKRFLIDYLRETFVYNVGQDNLNRIGINYTPLLLKLYMHYEISEEQGKMDEIKALIEVISKKAGPKMHEWYKASFEECND